MNKYCQSTTPWRRIGK